MKEKGVLALPSPDGREKREWKIQKCPHHEWVQFFKAGPGMPFVCSYPPETHPRVSNLFVDPNVGRRSGREGH